MPHLSETTVVHAPRSYAYREGEVEFFLDPEGPHWVAVDSRGAEILREIDGSRTFGELVSRFAARRGLEAGKAWLHVHDFVQANLRAGFLAVDAAAFDRPAYEGRSRYAQPAGLRELWLHTNNSCNLACTHCLVNSGPGETPGISPAELRRVVDDALAMGVERFYVTGGEPFLRGDIYDLIRRITAEEHRELIVLTNATLFRGPRGAGLDALSRELVKFQVSLDGAKPETNDPIRGAGTFEKALDGVRHLSGLGFDVSLTTVVTRQNLRELEELVGLAADHGARSQHLMWSHRRGRAVESNNGFFPDTADILIGVLRASDAAARRGIALDNLEAARRRANGQPGVKYDLGNAGWDSLCVYADGVVYPSAALANHRPLACGRVTENPLAARGRWFASAADG
jgi:MoaA/NifB/PqqE/SkfB family radical SAM enzyme